MAYTRSAAMFPSYGDNPRFQAAGITPPVSSVPNYGALPPGLLDKNAENLKTMASGELPQDVVDKLRQHAAEFGVASGLGGSEFAGYQGLKQLGLTSLDQINNATKMLTPFYTSPLQQQQYDLQRQNMMNQNAASSGSYWQNYGKEVRPPILNPGGGGGASHYMNPISPSGAPPTNPLAGFDDAIRRYLPSYGGGSAGGGSIAANFDVNAPTIQPWNNEDSGVASALQDLDIFG